jgi:hypothetical protein
MRSEIRLLQFEVSLHFFQQITTKQLQRYWMVGGGGKLPYMVHSKKKLSKSDIFSKYTLKCTLKPAWETTATRRRRRKVAFLFLEKFILVCDNWRASKCKFSCAANTKKMVNSRKYLAIYEIFGGI